MRDIGLVARREFVERARSKAFLISTVLVLLGIAAALVVPKLIGGGESAYRLGDVGPRAATLVDTAEQLTGPGLPLSRSHIVDRPAAEEALRLARIDAVVMDEATVLVREELPAPVQRALSDARRQLALVSALERAGVPESERAQALRPTPLEVVALHPATQSLGGDALIIGSVAAFMLYLLLILYGQMVAQGVVEEKASRAVEVLLSAVPARQLLLGKILGLGLLGLSQVLLIAVVGVGGALLLDTIEISGASWTAIAMVLAWFVLGFALYATVFAVAGSLVSRQEDLQAAVTPVIMLQVLALFSAQYTLADPGSTVSRITGLFPFSAPLVQPIRYAAGTAAPWEAPVAIALCLLAIAALLPIAVRFYTGGALRTGGRLKLRDAWRAARAS